MDRTQFFTRLVEALRSGDYPQTDGRLHNQDGYCCLGVACDLSRLGEWVWDEDLASYAYVVSLKEEERVVLPDSLTRALDLKNHLGEADKGIEVSYEVVAQTLQPDTLDMMKAAGTAVPGRPVALTGMNDSSVSFDEIANVIEATFLQPGT